MPREGDTVPLSETRPSTGQAPASGTEAATRVADVLLRLGAAAAPVGVSDLARDLGISKTVVHRILRSLASRDLVSGPGERGTYALGPAAAALGARALHDFDLRTRALPVLRRLQAQTRETTTVSALVGAARVYLDQVVSLSEIKMTVELGRPFPLHAGASSKVVLAFAPAELRAHVLAGELVRLTPLTIVDRRQLEAELHRVRAAGIAVSFGERQEGAGSVAAPVVGIDGEVVGAISACGPVARFTSEAVDGHARLVCEAGREISTALAGTSRTRPADGARAKDWPG